ncbi:uncharacterized protein LOC134775946 isoform X2 [Penaeus indicus]|uniref:uncharacterized protein LOC134775946 isoform X2 n=1 Tax=Penaeus indicus TaxID=29960 RepID=UPI00300D288A
MDMGGGRLIRIMILVLVMVLVWKIWDYSSLPVLEPPSFNAEIAKGMSSSKLQSDQEQNSVLQAPVDEEHLETRTTIHKLENESDKENKEEKQDRIQKGEGIAIRPIYKEKKLNDMGENSETMKIESKKKEHEESGKLDEKTKEKEKKNEEKEIEKGQKEKVSTVKIKRYIMEKELTVKA